VERGRDGVAHVTRFQLVLSVRIRRRRTTSLPPEVSLLSPHIINGYDVIAINYTRKGKINFPDWRPDLWQTPRVLFIISDSFYLPFPSKS
jgi:hypothetical protein